MAREGLTEACERGTVLARENGDFLKQVRVISVWLGSPMLDCVFSELICSEAKMRTPLGPTGFIF